MYITSSAHAYCFALNKKYISLSFNIILYTTSNAHAYYFTLIKKYISLSFKINTRSILFFILIYTLWLCLEYSFDKSRLYLYSRCNVQRVLKEVCIFLKCTCNSRFKKLHHILYEIQFTKYNIHITFWMKYNQPNIIIITL